MSPKDYKYIYGPVPSWRLGISLGIDPVSKGRKVCSFDCLYCQLGRKGLMTDERRIFIPHEDIIEEMDTLPSMHIDYITFSGAGEPTLAKNLGQMMRAIKKIRNDKIAVITNSSLMQREDVQQDLAEADFVIAKLDAPNQELLSKINRPVAGITFDKIVSGIKDFRKRFKGKLALQMMFIEQNRHAASAMADAARDIKPDEVQINTPLRPCAVKPLRESVVDEISGHFDKLNVISVYRSDKKSTKPLSTQETLKRRGKV